MARANSGLSPYRSAHIATSCRRFISTSGREIGCLISRLISSTRRARFMRRAKSITRPISTSLRRSPSCGRSSRFVAMTPFCSENPYSDLFADFSNGLYDPRTCLFGAFVQDFVHVVILFGKFLPALLERTEDLPNAFYETFFAFGTSYSGSHAALIDLAKLRTVCDDSMDREYRLAIIWIPRIFAPHAGWIRDSFGSVSFQNLVCRSVDVDRIVCFRLPHLFPVKTRYLDHLVHHFRNRERFPEASIEPSRQTAREFNIRNLIFSYWN